MRIGLKGFWKETKGMYLHSRLKLFWFEIKMALQRAYKGWCDNDCLDIDYWFRNTLINILNQYKEKSICLWWCPDGYELGKYDECTDRYVLTKDQMNSIIDVIIFHLKMSDADYVEKIIYGNCIDDDDWNLEYMKNRDYVKIERIRKQNQDASIDLIKTFIDDLWY